MRTYGEMPREHLELLRELEILEFMIDDREDVLPMLLTAKGLTSISYDYFAIHMEEEGERLLKRVNTKCPGYFVGPIFSQMSRDPEFKILVESLRKIPAALEVLSLVGFGP